MSFSEELDVTLFLFLNNLIFYLIYVCNKKTGAVLQKKFIFLFFYIQTIILWYVAFVYNDFLCFNPISYKIFIYLFLIFFFIAFYHIIKTYNFVNKVLKSTKKYL